MSEEVKQELPKSVKSRLCLRGAHPYENMTNREISIDKKRSTRRVALSNILLEKIPILKIMEQYGSFIPSSKEGLYEGECPIDECGGNLIINTKNNVFYCFQCLKGANIIHLTAYMHDISHDAAAYQLAFDYILSSELTKEIECLKNK